MIIKGMVDRRGPTADILRVQADFIPPGRSAVSGFGVVDASSDTSLQILVGTIRRARFRKSNIGKSQLLSRTISEGGRSWLLDGDLRRILRPPIQQAAGAMDFLYPLHAALGDTIQYDSLLKLERLVVALEDGSGEAAISSVVQQTHVEINVEWTGEPDRKRQYYIAPGDSRDLEVLAAVSPDQTGVDESHRKIPLFPGIEPVSGWDDALRLMTFRFKA